MLCYAGCVLLVLLACRRVIDSFRWGLFGGFARDDEAGVWSIIFFFLFGVVWSGSLGYGGALSCRVICLT